MHTWPMDVVKAICPTGYPSLWLSQLHTKHKRRGIGFTRKRASKR